ncbi:hypothetical protein ACPCXF_01460 [Lysinibacillus agricola]
MGISGSAEAPRKLCSARKRSASDKCFLCESKATATKRPAGTKINLTLL